MIHRRTAVSRGAWVAILSAVASACSSTTSDTGTSRTGTSDTSASSTGTSSFQTPAPTGGAALPTTTPPAASRSTGLGDQEVVFVVGGVRVHGSLRMPPGASGSVPAAVLLAGSGPTDRNGNNPGLPGDIGTLSSLADVLAQNGFASLRYDKVTTGATGLGPFAANPARLGYSDFVAEAQGALAFLAARPGIDRDRLLVVGHSEGALIALSTLAHPAPGQPVVAGLALLEGPGSRYLDLVSTQVLAALPQLTAAGALTPAQATVVRSALPKAISTLRATGSFPQDLPLFLRQQGFNPSNAHFLQEADQADPPVLAGLLPAGLPVLTTCSTQDAQVPCSEVAKVDKAVRSASLTAVILNKANHVLKDVSANPAAGIGDLHFSSELPGRLRTWLASIG